MKTFWTQPDQGATIDELITATKGVAFVVQEKLHALKNRYGGNAKGGLGVKKDSIIPFEEIDEDRILSFVFEDNVATNRSR